MGNITGKAGNEGAQKIIKIPTLVINDDDIRERPEQTVARLGISMAVSSCGQDSGFLSLLHFFSLMSNNDDLSTASCRDGRIKCIEWGKNNFKISAVVLDGCIILLL